MSPLQAVESSLYVSMTVGPTAASSSLSASIAFSPKWSLVGLWNVKFPFIVFFYFVSVLLVEDGIHALFVERMHRNKFE